MKNETIDVMSGSELLAAIALAHTMVKKCWPWDSNKPVLEHNLKTLLDAQQKRAYMKTVSNTTKQKENTK